MFKIPALDLEESVKVEIVDAAGAPVGAWLAIVAPDAPRAREARRVVTDKRLAAKRKLTAADLDNEEIDYHARIVTDWGGEPLRDTAGTLPALTKANVETLFRDYPSIYDQVRLAHADRANFMRRSSTDFSSSPSAS